nr:putative ribonuclease H-like domain-containing protein [Tanacetum cinerariifolium]
MQKRRNDVKERTTLLLALLDEHQLRFSKYKTAQELGAAILKTFGRNEATKKTKKNLLKQQYGNFKAEGTKTLEQTFNRLQVIIMSLLMEDICHLVKDNIRLLERNNQNWTPRQHNMYSIDLNNVVLYKDLTCLVTKAYADGCILWHMRLVTDDFSRFTWTFFLKTKDETTGILGNFITEIENLKDLKVKIIRYGNRGEFRNKEINDFCLKKGIKREFSNARTPQQNVVAKRRNRTLIEAARTMLVDAKLPVTFGLKQLTLLVMFKTGSCKLCFSLARTPVAAFSISAATMAASEASLPKSSGSCSFPSVFLTADVGWLRGVFSLVLMMSILGNAVVFAVPRMTLT